MPFLKDLEAVYEAKDRNVSEALGELKIQKEAPIKRNQRYV